MVHREAVPRHQEHPAQESLPKGRPHPELVRQKFTIESLDQNELFFVAPYIPLRSNWDIDIDLGRLRLLRPDYRRGRRFEYVLGTTAIVGGTQMPLRPMEHDTVQRGEPNDLTSDTREMPGGVDALPQLTALARRWIDESKLPKEDQLGRARYLERKLAASGQFQYSLAGQDRDPNLDPIEDFVSKHPVGHCEYFATALVLMLRSQRFRPDWSPVSSATRAIGTVWADISRSVSSMPTLGWKPICRPVRFPSR